MGGDRNNPFLHFFGITQLHLVEHHQAGAFAEPVAIGGQFLLHHQQIPEHVFAARIHQMQQQPGPLDVAQEFMAQAGAAGRPRDQAGNVREDGAIATGPPHHAQIWHQGGEGVVGDLRPGG